MDEEVQLFVISHPAIGSTLQVSNILSAVNLGASHSRGMSLFPADHRWESLHTPCSSPEMRKGTEEATSSLDQNLSV